MLMGRKWSFYGWMTVKWKFKNKKRDFRKMQMLREDVDTGLKIKNMVQNIDWIETTYIVMFWNIFKRLFIGLASKLRQKHNTISQHKSCIEAAISFHRIILFYIQTLHRGILCAPNFTSLKSNSRYILKNGGTETFILIVENRLQLPIFHIDTFETIYERNILKVLNGGSMNGSMNKTFAYVYFQTLCLYYFVHLKFLAHRLLLVQKHAQI